MVQYTDDLKKRMNKIVRAYNAKVRYNKTKTRGKGMLPRTIRLSNLMDKYSDKSKAELEKQLQLYQSFGERSSLNKANTESRISQWELNFFKSNIEKTKKFYDEEIDDLKRIIGGKPEYYLKQHNRLETLEGQRKELDKNLETLTEDQIKGIRGYINYAERSDIIKRQGFRLYLAQLDRAMSELGYKKKEREALLSKFDVLTENEFTEMVRLEDVIDDVYRLVYSPKGRGKYELLQDTKEATKAVERVINEADALIEKYHKSK